MNLAKEEEFIHKTTTHRDGQPRLNSTSQRMGLVDVWGIKKPGDLKHGAGDWNGSDHWSVSASSIFMILCGIQKVGVLIYPEGGFLGLLISKGHPWNTCSFKRSW